jgi:ATP-binding cassette subfamily B protein AbcA/BmrA
MKKWKPFLNLIREVPFPKRKLVFGFLLGMLSSAGTIAVPYFMQNMKDFSLQSMSSWMIVALVAAMIIQAVAGGVASYLLNLTGQTFVANLRHRLWQKMLALKIPYFSMHQTGETQSRLISDTAVTKNFVSDHLVGVVTGIITAVGSLGLLFYINWKMTLITLIAIPICAMVMTPIGRKMYVISKTMQDETASFSGQVTQTISEMKLVKLSNAERFEKNNGDTGIQKLLRLGIREGKMQAIMGPMMMLVIMLMLVIIIGYGGHLIATGALNTGGLLAYIVCLFQIIMPITQIATFFNQLQKASGATDRIIETLHASEEDVHVGETLGHMRENISFEHVSFRYDSEDHAHTLSDISFTLEPGKMTAIVGPSGGGKTTIFSVLERFYEPQEGSMQINGKNANTYSLYSWRSKIGYVSQESPLLAGTLRENLTYGLDREVSDEELISACEKANAQIFISQMPDGLGTEVGERGSKLSGGQRQRIAIARAILRNPDLLMLDEATASLDSESEKLVQEALSRIMQNRTTLVIAHRLSTVVDADQIIFLEKGVVTGIGTHAQLYATHPLYKKFADHQLTTPEEMR